MKKRRIAALEYMRGIAMAGVIGIHTGSQYLSNPQNNIHLIAVLEIITRFSVPIFFFISAFGLFYQLDPGQKFDYKTFLIRRLKSVLLPYLTWSALYLIHYTLVYQEYSFCSVYALTECFFFGLASYQLYFLVILLWFYLLMPFWIYLVQRLTVSRLFLLLALQIGFNYYSSYILTPATPYEFLNLLIEYRLNYWVFHYLWIFLLGGYCSIHSEAFLKFLKENFTKITIFFFGSCLILLTYYYELIFFKGYSSESAVNTAHQLSPAGILYTIGATFFLFAVCNLNQLPQKIRSSFSVLGKHSYFAYLIHPFIIHYLSLGVATSGHLMTAPITLIFYFLVLFFSIAAAIFVQKIGYYIPYLSLLLTGTKK